MPNVHEPIRDHVTLSIRCAPIAWASSFRSASPGEIWKGRAASCGRKNLAGSVNASAMFTTWRRSST